MGADGHIVDLTSKAAWHIFSDFSAAPQLAREGLVGLETPGHYRVVAEYDGQELHTPLLVTPAALKSLAINPTAPKLAQGLTQQFTATATFADGTTQDVTAMAGWSVKDVSGSMVATISSKGLATAKHVGKARISARYMQQTAGALLEVTPASILHLEISPANPSIAKGTAQRFIATGTFSDGTTQDVSSLANWTLTDVMGSDVGTIDGTGEVFGDNPGQARIEAEYQSQVAQTTLTVTPAAVVSLTLNPTSALIAKGMVQQFRATALLSDGSSQDVSRLSQWTSTDLVGTSVASVDANGLAMGQAVGQARVDCTYRGKTASAILDVASSVLLALQLNPASASVPKGLSQAFALTGSYSDGSTKDLTAVAVWTARDLVGADVISMTAGGVAVGRNLGQAEIKAAHQGKTATASLTVTAAVLVKLALIPGTAAVEVGKPVQFAVQGTYSDGAVQDVSGRCSYTATDIAPSSGVATISASGLATTKSVGQAKIEASCTEMHAETPLKVGATGYCSSDRWCWQNPLPQGNRLNAVYGSDANNVWTVGSGGTILKWNGTAWTQQLSGTKNGLYGIWGINANNIWVVGAAGTILKWNGTVFTPQASGTTKVLIGIYGLDANNIWAVGEDGIILKWNGTGWSTQEIGHDYYALYSIFATDANNVWAVGDRGIIRKWNGSSWAGQTTGTIWSLYGIWGSDANNVWAVGNSGTILKWNGTVWTAQYSGSDSWLSGVYGRDRNNVWAVGESGTILKWNGSTWAAQNSGTADWLTGAYGRDVNNLWVVGSAGTILKWNGSSWTSAVAAATTNALSSIYGLDRNNIWAVGSSGTILKWYGTAWAAQNSGVNDDLYGVFVKDANDAWAVGFNGTILKWNGSTWTAQPSGTRNGLFGVFELDANNAWAVGGDGTILKWNGSTWTAQPSGTKESLSGVWGSDANNVWVVGYQGTILKWNGSNWAVQPSGTLGTFFGIFGADRNNVWAVGETILKWNGTTWVAQSSGSFDAFSTGFAIDANNAWVVSYNGTIRKWNGSAWTLQESGAGHALKGIFASDVNNVWAVGYNGTILKFSGE